jgi:hypothetical protein
MKNKYSTHKRFVSDVVRYTDPDIVSEISSHYILLRSCSVLSDIPDEQIAWVAGRISNPDLSEVYQYLHRDGKGLSNQEIIFRIKRVKYIVNSEDGLRFRPTYVLSDIGQMFKNMITIPYSEVRKMVEESSEKAKESKQYSKSKGNLEWILKNVSWKGRDGHYNEGTMDANEASEALGISALRIRVILKDYYKDKPLPPPKEGKEGNKEGPEENKPEN